MRIYMVGSHNSGKTCLANYTSSKYKLPLINEVARMVLAERELKLDSLRTNLDLVDDYQLSIFKRQIEEEKKYKSFVSDRSFDNVAYAAQHSRQLSNLINSQELKLYIESLRAKDVVIFFIRPNKEFLANSNDGVRETTTWESMLSIDNSIKFLIEMFGLNYIQINTSSQQERVRLIDSVLRYL